jgi:hypothetical protein
MATLEINKKIFKLRKGDKTSHEIDGGKIDDLVKEFQKMNSKQNKPLSPQSIKSYASKINRVALMFGHAYESSEFLMDADKIIKKINESDLKSKKDYLSAVSKLLRYKKVPEAILNKYAVAMTQQKADETKRRGDNVAKSADIEKTGNMSLKDIQTKIKNYSIMEDGKIDDAKMINKLLASFYFMNFDVDGLPILVPRNDLLDFKLINLNKAKKQIPAEFNYIVMEGKRPTKIIMNNYKTRETYGKQTYKISPELAKILQEYITEYGKENGDYLFVMRDGKPFKSNNFTNLVENAMESILGKRIGIDLARQIILSNVYNSNPLMTINQKTEVARAFLHSVNIASEYVRPSLIKKD